MDEADRRPRPVRFGAFEVDLRAGELRKHGLKVKLQEQPFQILAMLLEHPGEIVTREELRKKLWPEDTFVDFDNSLNTGINKIREALGDAADNPRFVETLPRRGYRFIYPVAAMSSSPAGGGDAAATAGAIQESPLRKWRLAVAAGSAVVAIVAVLLALNVAGLRERVMQAVGAVHEPPLQIRSIAVLPLENLSGDPEQEYFADGMTDELITTLGKISALRVISRTSALHYKGTKKTLPEIARELNVDAVVEGSVLRSGGQVRITANLLYAPTDRHLWAQTYVRDLGDVLVLQSDVAQAIAREVRIKLTPQEQARLASRHVVQPLAYEACLKGRYHWNRRTGEDLRKGIESFEQAIDLDPKYAAAYAGLADCYSMLPIYADVPPKEAYPNAISAATKALELDETLAEAHTALAWTKLAYEFDWVGAEEEFERALALNPSYETAHHWYGLRLVWAGRFDQGLAELQRARELDPVSLVINRSLGMSFYLARRYDMAIGQLRKTLELDSNFAGTNDFLGFAYLQKGMHREAVAELRSSAESGREGSLVQGRLGYVLGMAGQRTQAGALLRQLRAQSKRKYVPAWNIAIISVGLGEKDQAILWLEKAYQERCLELVSLKVHPAYDPLRSDPRFQDLLRRMNFPP